MARAVDAGSLPDLDGTLQRLGRAAAAVNLATAEPGVAEAPRLLAALADMRAAIAGLRDRVDAVRAFNALADEYASVLSDADGGIRDRDHLRDIVRRLREVELGVRTMKGAGPDDDALAFLDELQSAIGRAIQQLAEIAPRRWLEEPEGRRGWLGRLFGS